MLTIPSSPQANIIWPKIAIIILNWNGFQDTVECLTSLKDVDYPNYKIVLVDNGSKDNEGLRLYALFPQVHLIPNTTNRGFAGGNNDGINWALEQDFDYIVNLNNDCTVTPLWLKNLVRGLCEEQADFGSSMILSYYDRDLICSDGDALLPNGGGFPVNRNKRYHGTSRRKKIFGACGAGSMYSRVCLKEIKIKQNQYFDELHFAYLEDVDLGIRLNVKGYQGIGIEDAVIYHKESQSAGSFSEFKLFSLEKNRILNMALNFPLPLILLGEMFYLFKLFFIFIYSLFFKKGIGSRYQEKMKIGNIVRMFMRARIWFFQNRQAVLTDRRERKARGFIQFKVSRFFRWDISHSLR